jgi:hypothetical protein
MLENVIPSEAKSMLPALATISEEALMNSGSAGRFTQTLIRQDPRAAAEWIGSLPADSPVRNWANGKFGAAVGRSAAELLNTPAK